jgi:chorismate mutase
MSVRAIRGAAQLAVDSKEEMFAEVPSLLLEMIEANRINEREIISIFFTVTPDISSDFPAAAARTLGWSEIPLMCAVEIAVPEALPRVVRVLMHVETPSSRGDIQHIYRGGAKALRPDLAK